MRPADMLSRMDNLSRMANDVAATKVEKSRRVGRVGGVSYSEPLEPVISTEKFMEWSTSVLHILRLTFGETSDHYRNFNKSVQAFDGHFASFPYCLGVLRAARDDLAGGFLSSVKELIAGDIFEDLLEMAEYLLEEGYHLPAAAIAGAVLEDSLRKLHAKHIAPWSGKSSIDKINKPLYKAKVYGKPQLGLVEAWGKLRNEVDHHSFADPEDIDANDVKRMIEGIRDFVAKYLS